jgi:hypothetical protein
MQMSYRIEISVQGFIPARRRDGFSFFQLRSKEKGDMWRQKF